jgi:hypothetical protein
MNTQQQEFFLAALSHFKDWSNILLVTTTAALGWVSTRQGNILKTTYYLSVWFLAISIVFGIFTLGFIPVVTEQFPYIAGQANPPPSFYQVRPAFFLGEWEVSSFSIKHFCFLQHLFFLIGILTYAFGSRFKGEAKPAQTGVRGQVNLTFDAPAPPGEARGAGYPQGWPSTRL